MYQFMYKKFIWVKTNEVNDLTEEDKLKEIFIIIQSMTLTQTIMTDVLNDSEKEQLEINKK
jgi:hypothetical protein